MTPQDVQALLPRNADTYDEPFGNSSAIPTFYCARLAKENGVDVLLAGDGGDELFAGNAIYVEQLDRLCPYGGDALIFGSFQGDEARIRSIKRLNSGQLEQVLIRYGKKEPADKPDPAPPEVKGAEVEELG